MVHLYVMSSDDAVTGSGDGVQLYQNITTPYFNLEDELSTPIESEPSVNVIAVATTVVSSTFQLATCGCLLLIFLLRKQTAKHASMIMISTLANICLVAISDLGLRAPMMGINEERLAATHPKLCVIMTLIPDYFMIVILLSLPLLSIERLIRLEAKKHLTPKQTRHLFSCLLVVGYSMALVVTILPTTNLFSPDVNTRCRGHLLYGYSFAYVYTALTAFSVMLTAVFSIAVIFRLKVKLSHLHTSMRKKIVMKQGTVSAVVITGVLFLALVPFDASLQLLLMCGSNQVTNKHFCDYVLPEIVFRGCILLHKLCLIVLPLVFLGLNPTLRHKIWLTLKKPKQMEQVVTISSNSMTVSKDSICERVPDPTDDGEDDLDGEFITITEDLSFGKSGDIKGEIKRIKSGSVRDRQSVLDLVDVMSIISERSELSRTYSGISDLSSSYNK